MTYADQWFIDPANNSKSPPLGAPEGGLAWERVSDTLRVVMAGVRETWDRVGTLGLQAANAVNITGGTIGAAVTILATAADATKLGGRTLAQVKQDTYDLAHPIHSIRFLETGTPVSVLTPTGIVASWVEQTAYADRLMAIYGPTLAGFWGDPDPVPGTLKSTTLTDAHLPPGTYVTGVTVGDTDPQPLGRADVAGDASINVTTKTGTGTAHTHNLPKGCAFKIFKRTA